MDLHTAGHRQGVVCAPHAAAVEAGRAVLAEGGNALEAMVAMAAIDRRRLSAHEPHRRRRLLARARAVRPRARVHGGGPCRRAMRAASFIASYEAIPPRGPLAALTVPAAIAGWSLALEAAKAHRRRACRSTCCSARRSAHAREGYVGDPQPGAAHRRTSSPSSKHVPGFAAAFLVDGKPPEAGQTLRQERARRNARPSRPCRARRLLPRRRRPRDRRRPRPRRQPGDARRSRKPAAPCSPSRSSVAIEAGTLYNTPPPTQGLASLMILALFERLRRHRGRELRSRPRPGRSDQARVPRARPRHHRSGAPAASARALSRRALPRRRGDEDRPPQGRGLARALRRRRHGLDGRGRRIRAWSSPTSSRSTGSSAPACVLPRTGVLMQNRGASFSLDPRRAQRAGAGTAAVPHAQSGAGGAARRPGDGLRHHGRRRPAADPGGAVHAPCAATASRSTARSTRRAGSSAGPGARPTPICGWKARFDGNLIDRLHLGRPRRATCWRSPIPTRWAMPAPSCCIRTARWKARTIRAPTAARRASDPVNPASTAASRLYSAAVHDIVRANIPGTWAIP